MNDGTEAVLALSPTGAVKDRYLWAPTIDQVLADEQPGTGELLWTFTDNLGTVRELARYTGGVTSVANHRVFDSYGQLKSETNAAVDHLFAFTGRMLDEDTGLQQHLNRWYDPKVGRWLSEDPIGFEAGDVNVYRYVGNEPGNWSDPQGLLWGLNEWWEASKAFSHEFFINQIYGGAKGIVTGETGAALGNRGVGIVETQTGRDFTGTASEWGRFARGVTGDMVGVNSIVEGGGGWDISNQQRLDAWQRGRRGAAGVGALAGTAAGGISAAGRYAPGALPTARALSTKPLWPGAKPPQPTAAPVEGCTPGGTCPPSAAPVAASAAADAAIQQLVLSEAAAKLARLEGEMAALQKAMRAAGGADKALLQYELSGLNAQYAKALQAMKDLME